jgi:hypothetical protein
VNYYGGSPSGYFANLGIESATKREAIRTGYISTHQAHKIANNEKIAVRELLMKDIRAKFPAAPSIDPSVIARNINSICWEKGVYPAELARLAGVSVSTGLNYVAQKGQHIDRGLLSKIAATAGLTLAQLADPTRPVVQPMPVFQSNLEYLLAESGLPPTPFSQRCGVELRALRSLLNGVAPNPHQIARLGRQLDLSPRELLMQDLRQETVTPEGVPPAISSVAADQTEPK